MVKPTWLLTITCTVPPVRYPRSSARFSVSATTPCPANAASPCIATGSTEKPVPPLSSRSCLARTMPSSTGSTVSRCDGLAVSVTLVSPSPNIRKYLPSAPRWYFTSPEPCAWPGSRLPSNSWKICEIGLPTMFASTFSRPRCGMPMTTSSSSYSAALSSTVSSSAMTDSPPSSENRFWPTYLVCRNVSNASAAFSFDRMYFCTACGGFSCRTSTRSWIQRRSAGSRM